MVRNEEIATLRQAVRELRESRWLGTAAALEAIADRFDSVNRARAVGVKAQYSRQRDAQTGRYALQKQVDE